MTPKPKPIHEDVAVERAWQTGRRIYVRCHYESRLGEQLREIGGHWDRDTRMLWIGSGKKEQLLPLLTAAAERVREVNRIKAEGRWVRIPYEAAEIRDRAKQLHALWDQDTRRWAFPTDEGRDEIAGLVDEHWRLVAEARAAEQRAREEQRLRDREADAAQRARDAEHRRERVLAESGRTPTGEDAELRVISTQIMNKSTAWAQTKQLGALVRLDDGRRGIVVGRRVWFSDSEAASSCCWHDETHDIAHWDLSHTVAVVEPTPDELRADADQQAGLDDAAEVHQLVGDVARSAEYTGDWDSPAAAEQLGTLDCWSGGIAERRPAGTLIVTTDRLVYQHPGYYDDYQRTQQSTTDPTLHARALAVLDGGSRKCHHIDQLLYEYTVEVSDYDCD